MFFDFNTLSDFILLLLYIRVPHPGADPPACHHNATIWRASYV